LQYLEIVPGTNEELKEDLFQYVDTLLKGRKKENDSNSPIQQERSMAMDVLDDDSGLQQRWRCPGKYWVAIQACHSSKRFSFHSSAQEE
jgi:hypothetical protein